MLLSHPAHSVSHMHSYTYSGTVSVQVHLITAHVDGLTAKVSAPLDRLVDIALQASRTSSMAKQHLLSMFENKAGFMRDKLEVVCIIILLNLNSEVNETISSIYAC